MSKELLGKDWTGGRFVTYLPPGIKQSELTDFETGGKVPQPGETTLLFGDEELRATPVRTVDQPIEQAIRRFLGANKKAVCLFEDATSRIGILAFQLEMGEH